MDDYINISTLNDFIFCPYSIYLHNVYMGGDEELFHATPQTQGKASHQSIDNKTYRATQKPAETSELPAETESSKLLVDFPVFSSELGIKGKIDIFKVQEKTLIERKHQLLKIYQGQLYQLWGQYFCLLEMGYAIDNLAFYVTSTNKTIAIDLPTSDQKRELIAFIDQFRHYDPNQAIATNPNKCTHCIYCNLCDKTDTDHVYN